MGRKMVAIEDCENDFKRGEPPLSNRSISFRNKTKMHRLEKMKPSSLCFALETSFSFSFFWGSMQSERAANRWVIVGGTKRTKIGAWLISPVALVDF